MTSKPLKTKLLLIMDIHKIYCTFKIKSIMGKRFEYKTVIIEPKGFWGTKYEPADIDKTLNQYGSEGWELVTAESRDYGGSFYGIIYTFKREL